jgi:hypothetical protein
MENIGPLVATALRELGLQGASSGLQEEKERGGIRSAARLASQSRHR